MPLWLDLLPLLLRHHARSSIRLDIHQLHLLVLLRSLQLGVLLHHQLSLRRMVLVNHIGGHTIVLALRPTINAGAIVLNVLQILA